MATEPSRQIEMQQGEILNKLPLPNFCVVGQSRRGRPGWSLLCRGPGGSDPPDSRNRAKKILLPSRALSLSLSLSFSPLYSGKLLFANDPLSLLPKSGGLKRNPLLPSQVHMYTGRLGLWDKRRRSKAARKRQRKQSPGWRRSGWWSWATLLAFSPLLIPTNQSHWFPGRGCRRVSFLRAGLSLNHTWGNRGCRRRIL